MKESKFRQTLRAIYSEPHGITIIKGNWKTGKTNFILHLLEILKDMGLIHEAAGNVRVYSDSEMQIPVSDPVKYVDNFELLKVWMFRNLKRKLFIYDEAMKNAPSKRAMTALNAEWQRVIPELSKGKVHLFALTQEESMTEKIFRHKTFNVATWEKMFLSPKNPQYRKRVKVSSKLLKETLIFNNVQPTEIIYNPYLSASWSMEPQADFSTLENSLELKVAWLYAHDKTLRQIQTEIEEVSHPEQTKRLLKSGLISLFKLSHVTGVSSGYKEGGKRDKTESNI